MDMIFTENFLDLQVYLIWLIPMLPNWPRRHIILLFTLKFKSMSALHILHELLVLHFSHFTLTKSTALSQSLQITQSHMNLSKVLGTVKFCNRQVLHSHCPLKNQLEFYQQVPGTDSEHKNCSRNYLELFNTQV